QLQYVQQLEALYTRRILDILEPVVGRQNIKAQVTAEVDFSQTEQTSESHKPNQTPDSSTIRSQQLVESGAGAGGNPPTGIPGATSNQPPARRRRPSPARRRRCRPWAVPAARWRPAPSANPSPTMRWTARCGWSRAPPVSSSG